MEKKSYLLCLAGLSVVFWIILFLDRMFIWQDHNIISAFTAQMEMVVNFFILLSTFKIYKKMDKENRKEFILFIIVNIGLTLSDIAWYSINYLNDLTPLHLREARLFIDVIPFYIWTIAIIIFLCKLLNKYILQRKHRIKIFLIFIILDVVTILLFLSSIQGAGKQFSALIILKLVFFITYLIVFDFVILTMIYSESLGLTLFLSGIIILISGDFFSMYSTFSLASTHLLSYGELLFLLGLLFNCFGSFIIYNNNDFHIQRWIRKDTAIKGKLAFWCFSGGIASFILFFMLAYIFDIINKETFSVLPICIMIYSIVVVTFSLYMGKHFEIPFKQLTGNIKLLMMVNKKNHIDVNFSTEEFIFLQNFILEAFKYRDEKYKAQRESAELKFMNETQQIAVKEQQEFRTAIGQMVHDIQSPLSSLSTIVAEQSANLPENTRITLRNATNRIADITNNMFNKYENKEVTKDESIPLLVSLALLQVLSEKRYEYSKSNVTFEINVEKSADYFIFININPSDFKRMISNIINNAVEATKDKPDRKVQIELCNVHNRAVIFINDNGCGMPQHIQDKFYQDIAVTEGKENGHGIGLVQVREVVNTYGGTCTIFVTENVGTKIVLRFPLVQTPHWVASEIKLTKDDMVVILDDDNSTHGAWENKFKSILTKFPSLQIKYFIYGKEAVNYINNLNSEQKENTFLLTDYELLNQNMNGLDIVKQTGIKRALLVTSHASNLDIQEQVLHSGIKALPKELTYAVPILVDKKIPKYSKKVDMVWVEDQMTFVDDMVREYYSHITVDIYYEPEGFMADVWQYPLDTRFILDTNYYRQDNDKPYLLNGFIIARKLHEMGYTKLILFAGEAIKPEKIPPYLTVVLKNDLIKRKNLDKI